MKTQLLFSVIVFSRRSFSSDGVAEAQDAEGHLFGFERIEAMLRQPITAAEVATAAQEFGQQDDISAMRLVREPKATERTSAEPALAMGRKPVRNTTVESLNS